MSRRLALLSDLSWIAVPFCSTCGYEVSGGKHIGYYAMDFHHEPTKGARPAVFGSVRSWDHDPKNKGAVIVLYRAPDGREEKVRSYADGRREVIE